MYKWCPMAIAAGLVTKELVIYLRTFDFLVKGHMHLVTVSPMVPSCALPFTGLPFPVLYKSILLAACGIFIGVHVLSVHLSLIFWTTALLCFICP